MKQKTIADIVGTEGYKLFKQKCSHFIADTKVPLICGRYCGGKCSFFYGFDASPLVCDDVM